METEYLILFLYGCVFLTEAKTSPKSPLRK